MKNGKMNNKTSDNDPQTLHIKLQTSNIKLQTSNFKR
jgi:hypothetical protein